MLRVGITGGIGSGKTTVCGVFENLGVPVYYADTEAKKLYAENKDLQKALLEHFGPDVIVNGNINKPLLAGLAFGSPELSQKLNAVVHPFVFDHYEAWCKAHEQHSYTMKEAAILFESGGYRRVHRVIGVIAPDELRIQRVMQRDGCTRDGVLMRMQKQMQQDVLAAKCHYLINNDDSESLIEQVRLLNNTLKEEAEKDWPFLV